MRCTGSGTVRHVVTLAPSASSLDGSLPASLYADMTVRPNIDEPVCIHQEREAARKQAAHSEKRYAEEYRKASLHNSEVHRLRDQNQVLRHRVNTLTRGDKG